MKTPQGGQTKRVPSADGYCPYSTKENHKVELTTGEGGYRSLQHNHSFGLRLYFEEGTTLQPHQNLGLENDKLITRNIHVLIPQMVQS